MKPRGIQLQANKRDRNCCETTNGIQLMKTLRHVFILTDVLSKSRLDIPGRLDPLRMELCDCDSRGQQTSVCWMLFSRCLRFCIRLYSCLILCRICSGLENKGNSWLGQVNQLFKISFAQRTLVIYFVSVVILKVTNHNMTLIWEEKQ
jgi:hypothetical protein